MLAAVSIRVARTGAIEILEDVADACASQRPYIHCLPATIPDLVFRATTLGSVVLHSQCLGDNAADVPSTHLTVVVVHVQRTTSEMADEPVVRKRKLGQPDLTPFHPADTVAVRPVPFSAFPTSFFGRPGFLH